MGDEQQVDSISVPVSVQSKQSGLSKKQILGFTGAAILVIGVFMPVVSLPIVGSINYYNNGNGDGLLIIVFAIISAIVVYIKKYPWLYATAAASLLVIAYDFLNVQSKISDLRQQFGDNVYSNLILNSIQMQWGWAVLVIGALLLIVATTIKEESS